MYDECDFIARQLRAEEWLAEAAHERLLRQISHSDGIRRTKMTATLLLRAGRLLVRAGQRLEVMARTESLLGAPASLPPLSASPTGRPE